MSTEFKNTISEIFKYLAISLLFMVLGFFVGAMFVPPSFVYFANRVIAIISVLLLVLALFSRKRIIPRRFSMNYVYAFTFIDGILLYPLFVYYLQDLGIGIFVGVVAAAIAIFASLSYMAGKKQGGYYLGLGNVLFAGLLGVLVLTLVSFFFGGRGFSILISIISVIVFSGYILYDISLIKYSVENRFIRDKNDLSIYVLNLYLDFINILLDLLNIVSEVDD